MVRTLIAGGAGFIGSHLAQRLVENGHRVTVLDNLSSGKRKNLAGLPIRFMRGDITKISKLPAFDEIYHLASMASPVFYQRAPIETALANSIGTYNLLMHAKRTGARFLYASTSEVYGDPLVHPQRESYWGNVNPVGIRSCYDESKRLGETLVMDFHRCYGLTTHIARIFNTYGPRMARNDGRVIPNFIDQATSGKPLTIYGSGAQTRSFCFVSDTVSGLMSLMASAESNPVNIGNPHEMTVKEIATMIIAMTGSQSRIIAKPLPADDPRQRRPDIARAKKVLGWRPRVSLEKGLEETITWFKNNN